MRRFAAHLRKSATYANVMSTIAVFVAVSTGGAYAKATLIDGRSIKSKSMPGNRIAPNSITAVEIKNGSITVADLNKAAKPAITTPNPTTGTGSSTPTGNGETAIAHNPDGSSWEWAMVDVVPKGVGLPCRLLNQSFPNGVWKEPTPGSWLCTVDRGNGATVTAAPAAKGSPNTSGSGAVNA